MAEDSAEIGNLIRTVLVQEGHDVRWEADGRRALDTMLEQQPDLLVLDLMMPVVDGYETLREMKRAGIKSSTKVLILTARASEADWVRGYRLGADGYLTKPFEIDELVAAVEDLLTMSTAEIDARREEELTKARLLSRLESLFEGP